jgi:5-methylcytosine-specific restriction endonuclease McrA
MKINPDQLTTLLKRRYLNFSDRSARFDVPCPTFEELYQILNGQYYDSRTCPYCGDPIALDGFDGDSPSIDHKVPLTDGGDNSPDNLVLVHAKCNLVKGTMDHLSFTYAIAGNRQAGGQDAVRKYLNSAYKGAKANKITRHEIEKGGAP